MRQLSLFKSEVLRDAGILTAITSANTATPGWADKAYQFLLKYIVNNKEFMTEEMRVASEGIVPFPPSARAWGAVIIKAKRNKLIQSAGFRAVRNPKAHRTPATVWRVLV